MIELNYIFLIILWILYFLIHSLLAGFRAKTTITHALPYLANSYRFIYNILAIVLLLPQLYLIYAIPSALIWTWSGELKIMANLLTFAALAGFIWSLKYYNNIDFLGLNQIRRGTAKNAHQFTLSPLHRYVRHPWYFFALILIWTRDMNAHFFISACCMTVYFIVGSIYEERKLVIEFGQIYREYQRAVPGLIPSFRRYLTPQQAEHMLNSKPK